LRLKILEKLRTAHLNSEFPGSYKQCYKNTSLIFAQNLRTN